MDKEKNKKKAKKDFENISGGSGNGGGNEESEKFAKAKKKAGEGIYKKELEKELETGELLEEVELLRKELDEYKKIEDEYIDRIKRLHADYDNYRKRTLKEQVEHIRRANKDLIEKLLPVIDSFEKALEVGKGLKGGKDEFFIGVNMIYKKLMDILKNENVKVVDPKGEEFDPQLCEAAATEGSEEVGEGIILEVLRKGYMIDDFLIRPAVVKVCKKS